MNYQEELKLVSLEFPDFKIVPKTSSKMMTYISKFLRFITFGYNTNFDSFITTIKNTMYVPNGWEEKSDFDKYVILCHETIHLRQAKRYSFVLFAFLYVFVPIPLGFAWFRASFEMEAYEVQIRLMKAKYGIHHVQSDEFRSFIISQFNSANYGWMMPFKSITDSWYDRVISDISEE